MVVAHAGTPGTDVGAENQKAAAKAKAKARDDMRKAQAEVRRAMSDAKKTLAESMRMAREMNVIAIVTKVGDCTQRLKIEQNARGAQQSTVLQPLYMQGVTLVNDGSKSYTYWPDQRMVLECDGDLEGLADIESRAELAAQNYELTIEIDGERIAGRPTVRVWAEPKVAGIPARQFYLDEQTLYPLRLMQETAAGGWKVNMDTQVVDFPKEMPSINLNLVGTPRKVKFDAAQPLSSVRNAKDRLGFEPVVPKKLPFGFQVQRSELRRNEDGQLIMLWLTDGLATARVYEFRCNQMRDGIWSQGANTVLTEDGVTMMLVSDLQPDVRRTLLRAFAHRPPASIPPPPSPSVTFGVKPPPIPSPEPSSAKPMFVFPEPAVAGKNESTDSSPITQDSNFKGD
jgi:hypothetical protein